MNLWVQACKRGHTKAATPPDILRKQWDEAVEKKKSSRKDEDGEGVEGFTLNGRVPKGLKKSKDNNLFNININSNNTGVTEPTAPTVTPMPYPLPMPIPTMIPPPPFDYGFASQQILPSIYLQAVQSSLAQQAAAAIGISTQQPILPGQPSAPSTISGQPPTISARSTASPVRLSVAPSSVPARSVSSTAYPSDIQLPIRSSPLRRSSPPPPGPVKDVDGDQEELAGDFIRLFYRTRCRKEGLNGVMPQLRYVISEHFGSGSHSLAALVNERPLSWIQRYIQSPQLAKYFQNDLRQFLIDELSAAAEMATVAPSTIERIQQAPAQATDGMSPVPSIASSLTLSFIQNPSLHRPRPFRGLLPYNGTTLCTTAMQPSTTVAS